MALIQALKDFFDTIFRSSSPEVQKKLRLRKIESSLKDLPKSIYKNGMILPNFAEALRILYINTKPIQKILDNTLNCEDITRGKRYEAQLVITGYSHENLEILKKINYESRKEELLASSQKASRVFEEQRRDLEKLMHELNTKEFIKLDLVIVKLKQLGDLCNFNFVTPLQSFDNHYNPLEPSSVPSFQDLPAQNLEHVFEDLYYVLVDFDINTSVAKALIALAQMLNPDSFGSKEQNSLIANCKKIEAVTKKILVPQTLKSLVMISKGNPDYEPKVASYKATARQDFVSYMERQFISDENRIKREIKDETIKNELNELFGSRELEVLNGYNTEMNNLIQTASVSFMWITPLRILKTFLLMYYPEDLKALFSDIVVEGFFNNPTYKSQFSSNVFMVNESLKHIIEFEQEFDKEGKYDQAVINGFIKDSHKDNDFLKKLNITVDSINGEAKKLIQKEITALNSLYASAGDLIQDSKKPACEIVSNLKMLMMSSRNRDKTDTLEKQYPEWHIFFEIMKNYAIINIAE